MTGWTLITYCQSTNLLILSTPSTTWLEWYDSLTFLIAWNDLQQRFSRYFSTQGRSIKHLHDKWRNFSFTPGQDDIEAYIRDVKEAAHQLNYNDEAVLHLVKATMPSEIYGTLYNQHDLNTVITMVKDIYAKKPEPANPPTTTGGAAAPFTLIKAPNGSSKRVHFQDGETLSDRIDVDQNPVSNGYGGKTH